MSDLKHQSIEQLRVSKAKCLEKIGNLKSNLNGQQERLKWINKYLFEKAAQEMTLAEIEQKLGHKVIFK